MNKNKIAKTIVLHFHQGHGDNLSKYSKLASELQIELTEEQIIFGIDNVFFNNEKKWADWQKEGGLGMQLYGLRMFVSNAIIRLNNSPFIGEFEDEVSTVEFEVPSLVNHLKKMGIIFKKKWWYFK